MGFSWSASTCLFFFLISINIPVILLTKLVSSYNTCTVESNSLSEFLVVDLKSNAMIYISLLEDSKL